MIAAVINPSDARRSRSPYPERSDEKLGSLDYALAELLAGLSFRFERGAARLNSLLPAVAEHADACRSWRDEDLAHHISGLRGPLLRHGFSSDLIAQSFGLVSEAMWRTLKMRPYPVQLLGAYGLLQGRFIEMETGEGKTLTGAIAAATAALAGKPVHVITVNDYLAARDAEDLRTFYEALGLTVGVIQHGQDADARRAAYACDVTYVVNKEVAFDYLRDRLALGHQRTHAEQMVGSLSRNQNPLLLRGLCFAIVDEADSVLIDEARTPLIISGSETELNETSVYQIALAFAQQLSHGDDFLIGSTDRLARMTPAGSQKLRQLSKGLGGVWEARKAREELVVHALSALLLYRSDQHYVVADGKVMIIDEFTGRIAEGRSWQHGLHQLIEVKEGCELTQRQQTKASITYQRFFRRYLHLAGMSGTLAEVAAELYAVYGTPVTRIPTHRPTRRRSCGLQLFRTAEEKWAAIVDSVARHQGLGRPVLVGTRSIAASDILSHLLTSKRIEHVVLNAHHDDEEAAIVAEAGGARRVTVATNMAGRGTDIKLAPGIPDAGGLHVILTEFHEAARIDRQLIGRGGRQGDPGTFEVFASLEDELINMHAPGPAKLLKQNSGPGTPLSGPLARGLQWHAQARAQRFHRRVRRQTLRMQDYRDTSLAFANPE